MALTAPTAGGYALVAMTLGAIHARKRALARHRAALGQSRRLCEELSEHIGWLHHPDDADRIPEVIGVIRSDAAALEVCVGRLAGAAEQPGGLPTEELAALVEAIDAEVRLVILGDAAARIRARHLTSCLRAGAAALVRHEAAAARPRLLDGGACGDDTPPRSV